MFASVGFTSDASRLRETLDHLREALERPFAIVSSNALGLDRQAIAGSLKLLLEQIDAVDLTAIRATSGLVQEYRSRAETETLRAFFDALERGWKARVARILGGAKLRALTRLLAASTPDLLRILGREDDENSHSDLIAWLLSPTRAPSVAKPALLGLVSCHENAPEWSDRVESAVSSGLVSVRREMLIGRELADSDDLCRVDILVSGPGFVLAIENKVWSHEHGDQTNTYWRWLEPMRCLRGGLFLSPSGMTAACPNFSPVSYLQLVSALLEGPAAGAISSTEEIVLASYLKTLARNIVPVQIRAALRAANEVEVK